jgi:uracil phosphoribosyltransferase
MPLHTTTHPLIAHKMTKLRDVKTNSGEFRSILKEITFYLGYEATREIKVSTDVVKTPMNMDFAGSKLAERVAIIPILRAGLGMCDAMLELIPQSAVHHIGKLN